LGRPVGMRCSRVKPGPGAGSHPATRLGPGAHPGLTWDPVGEPVIPAPPTTRRSWRHDPKGRGGLLGFTLVMAAPGLLNPDRDPQSPGRQHPPPEKPPPPANLAHAPGG